MLVPPCLQNYRFRRNFQVPIQGHKQTKLLLFSANSICTFSSSRVLSCLPNPWSLQHMFMHGSIVISGLKGRLLVKGKQVNYARPHTLHSVGHVTDVCDRKWS